MNGKPVINQLNNGVLTSTNAMPLKNTTSDNGESFAIDRALFEKAYQPPFNYALKQTTKSFSHGLQVEVEIQEAYLTNYIEKYLENVK